MMGINIKCCFAMIIAAFFVAVMSILVSLLDDDIHYEDKLMYEYPYMIWRKSQNPWQNVFFIKGQKIKFFSLMNGCGVGKTKKYYFLIPNDFSKISLKYLSDKDEFIVLLKKYGINKESLNRLESFVYIEQRVYKNHHFLRQRRRLKGKWRSCFSIYKYPVFSKVPFKLFKFLGKKSVQEKVIAFATFGNYIYGRFINKNKKEYFVINVVNDLKIIFQKKEIFYSYLRDKINIKSEVLLGDSSMQYYLFFKRNLKLYKNLNISTILDGLPYDYWELSYRQKAVLAADIKLLAKKYPYYYGYSRYGWFILNVKVGTYFLHWDKDVFMKRLISLDLDVKLRKVNQGTTLNPWDNIPGLYHKSDVKK